MKTKTVPVGLLAAAAVTATLGSAGFAAAADQVSIAVVEKTLSNPFWVTMKNGAEYAGTEIGARVEVQASTAENAVEEQSTLLQTMFAQGFDCYVVSSITETNLLQPLAAISAAGKPIVNVAAKVDDAAAAAAGIHFATFIDLTMSRPANSPPKRCRSCWRAGKIAIVGGLPGDVANRNRISGFEAGAGVLQIVQTVAADWIERKPSPRRRRSCRPIRTSAASSPRTTPWRWASFRPSRMPDARTCGSLASTGSKTPSSRWWSAGGLTATVSQYPWAFGTLGVKASEAAIRGVELPDFVESPIAVITAANAEAALKAFPEPLEPIPRRSGSWFATWRAILRCKLSHVAVPERIPRPAHYAPLDAPPHDRKAHPAWLTIGTIALCWRWCCCWSSAG